MKSALKWSFFPSVMFIAKLTGTLFLAISAIWGLAGFVMNNNLTISTSMNAVEKFILDSPLPLTQMFAGMMNKLPGFQTLFMEQVYGFISQILSTPFSIIVFAIFYWYAMPVILILMAFRCNFEVMLAILVISILLKVFGKGNTGMKNVFSIWTLGYAGVGCILFIHGLDLSKSKSIIDFIGQKDPYVYFLILIVCAIGWLFCIIGTHLDDASVLNITGLIMTKGIIVVTFTILGIIAVIFLSVLAAGLGAESTNDT